MQKYSSKKHKMPEKYLYEYAVIRVVPKVDREEFLNVGIILFSKQARFIRMMYKMDSERMTACFPELDIEQVQKNLCAFEKIARGAKDGGPMAQEDLPSRFRWLTALRSSVIQTSRPHPGMCDQLEETVERLFGDLVL